MSRIEGSDYAKANIGNGETPTYTIAVPDDLRPVSAGATAEAWLVFTYQLGDYSSHHLVAGDHVRLNGVTNFDSQLPFSVAKLLNRNDTFRLEADIDRHDVFADLDDRTRDNTAGAKTLSSLVKKSLKLSKKPFVR